MASTGRGSVNPEPSVSTAHAERLAPVVAAAVTGDLEALAVLVRCPDGVDPSLVREALLLLVPFAGVPRALDALGVYADAFPQVVPLADVMANEADPRARFRERGVALFARVYGANRQRVEAGLRRIDPEVPDWVLEDAYGKVLARGHLAAAEVECLAVVLLSAQGLVRQLKGHVAGALGCGAAPERIHACLSAAAGWIAADVRERAETWIAELGQASR